MNAMKRQNRQISCHFQECELFS